MFPDLVVASLGALMNDKPNDTARVLFDATNGIFVNRRTSQERTPIAAEVNQAMREKAKQGVRTFALTADVSEAHRQIPIDERDWQLPAWSQGQQSATTLLVAGVFGAGTFVAVLRWRGSSDQWSQVPSSIACLLHPLCWRQWSTLLQQKRRQRHGRVGWL